MISYLGSLVQFSPGAGRAGLCRELSLWVGSTGRVLAGQPEAWLGALSTGTPRPLPPRSQGVFRQDPGPVCRWEGVASLGLSLPLSPPPASYLQRGWPALLWSFSVPLFCEPTAVCSGRSILPSLSHSLKNLPPTALRAFWPVPTLSNAARSSPFRPHLLVAVRRLGYFSAGSCF